MSSLPDPMSPHRFHILAALASRDLHGSGIVRDVLDQTGGTLRLWPATLYGALDDLEGEGLIRELEDHERPDRTSQKRRYYRLTRVGRTALTREAERLQAVAGRAIERLGRA